MRIVDLIRKYLKCHPEGGFTEQIAEYCVKNGAIFKTSDINKSVSGQLSKIRSYGEVTFIAMGKVYLWKLINA